MRIYEVNEYEPSDTSMGSTNSCKDAPRSEDRTGLIADSKRSGRDQDKAAAQTHKFKENIGSED
jgi:hypothetical protein